MTDSGSDQDDPTISQEPDDLFTAGGGRRPPEPVSDQPEPAAPVGRRSSDDAAEPVEEPLGPGPDWEPISDEPDETDGGDPDGRQDSDTADGDTIRGLPYPDGAGPPESPYAVPTHIDSPAPDSVDDTPAPTQPSTPPAPPANSPPPSAGPPAAPAAPPVGAPPTPPPPGPAHAQPRRAAYPAGPAEYPAVPAGEPAFGRRSPTYGPSPDDDGFYPSDYYVGADWTRLVLGALASIVLLFGVVTLGFWMFDRFENSANDSVEAEATATPLPLVPVYQCAGDQQAVTEMMAPVDALIAGRTADSRWLAFRNPQGTPLQLWVLSTSVPDFDSLQVGIVSCATSANEFPTPITAPTAAPTALPSPTPLADS